MPEPSALELTTAEADLAEALAVVELVRKGERQRVEGRHLLALADFAAALEQEIMATAPCLDRFDREAIRKRLEGRNHAMDV